MKRIDIVINKSWRFSIQNIALVLLMFLYFRPAEYIFGSTIYKLGSYTLLLFLGFLLMVIVLRIRVKAYHPSAVTMLLFALFFWSLIGSTIVNDVVFGNPVSYTEGIRYFAVSGSFILFADFGLREKPKQFLKTFVIVGTLMCSLNAVCMFLFHSTGGMSEASAKGTMYLLAQDNSTYYWTWTVMVVDWAYYFLYHRDKKHMKLFAGYTILTIASYLYTWSVTPLIATGGVAVLTLLLWNPMFRGDRRRRKKGFSLGRFNTLWIIDLLWNYLFAVQRIYEKMAFIVQTVLKKSITLTGRSQIWEESVRYFKQSPIIGYGQEARELTIEKISINHTHNVLLETLYRGGLISGVLFLAVLIVLGQKTRRVREVVYDYIMVAVVIFLFTSVADFAFYRYTYLILFLLLDHPELFVGAGRQKGGAEEPEEAAV